MLPRLRTTPASSTFDFKGVPLLTASRPYAQTLSDLPTVIRGPDHNKHESTSSLKFKTGTRRLTDPGLEMTH